MLKGSLTDPGRWRRINAAPVGGPNRPGVRIRNARFKNYSFRALRVGRDSKGFKIHDNAGSARLWMFYTETRYLA